ncbi:MAG: cation diffusion facilitator family transporter [Paludibacteraceae bacterium]|nr:cation diffusion facilitator family transporter [Paludibacteraceae bacterium]
MRKNSREKQIANVTICGAGVNLLLTIAKMAAGVWGHSAAMVADAVHSLSDLISDFVVLVMVHIAGQDTDKNHDYGHGKFETLATVAVALLLLVVGGRLIAHGIEQIRYVAQGGTLARPGMIALWAALVSIITKEILYQWTAHVGRQVNSQAVIANAWHHRSDALSSIGALIGIGGAILLGGKWTVLDPIVGCVISVVIIAVAVKMLLPALSELTEASLSDEVEQHITQLATAVSGVEDVHNLKTRRSGPNIIIDLHIVVNGEKTVREAHDITIDIENALRNEFGEETQISIHVEPDKNAK